MAGVTGLEPATSGVTGRRSNQLSYTPKHQVERLIRSAANPVKRSKPKLTAALDKFGPHKAKTQRPKITATTTSL
jgi:hypothetical protein